VCSFLVMMALIANEISYYLRRWEEIYTSWSSGQKIIAHFGWTWGVMKSQSLYMDKMKTRKHSR
jgi:hypothetical protein